MHNCSFTPPKQTSKLPKTEALGVNNLNFEEKCVPLPDNMYYYLIGDED